MKNGDNHMATAEKLYDAKMDSKKRITARNASKRRRSNGYKRKLSKDARKIQKSFGNYSGLLLEWIDCYS